MMTSRFYFLPGTDPARNAVADAGAGFCCHLILDLFICKRAYSLVRCKSPDASQSHLPSRNKPVSWHPPPPRHSENGHLQKSTASAMMGYRCHHEHQNGTVQDGYDYESIVVEYFASLLFRYSLCYIFVSYLAASWVVGSGD